ncbi:MAG: helix-turn-helix domain-containing protein [Acidimicrobiales bacterium]
MTEGFVATRNEWLSTQAAAASLGIKSTTLYRLIDEGKITAYKIGKLIRLRPTDIQAFLESARIPPGSIGHMYEQWHPRDAGRANSNAKAGADQRRDDA